MLIWIDSEIAIIGLIGQLTREKFNILDNLQQRMASCVKSIGNIEHEVYPLIVVMILLLLTACYESSTIT